jgi:biopolymer transport protein ExbB
MGDPAALAANISEALWTTAAGLVIAVPSLTLYFYFRGRLSKLVARTDRHALRLLNALRRAVVARHPGASSAQNAPHPQPHPEFS